MADIMTQGELFKGTKRLEVHQHTYVSGPHARGCYRNGQWFTGTFSHSHEGGDKPHQHPHTGPACYTIDKDEWARATGLRGGGRKRFTTKPTGEQLPIRDLEDWQRSFEVVVCDPPQEYLGDGPGIALAVRMMKSFGMTCTVRDGRMKRA